MEVPATAVLIVPILLADLRFSLSCNCHLPVVFTISLQIDGLVALPTLSELVQLSTP